MERLVTEVLLDRNCAETSNYRFSTGTDYGINGIGYFEFNGDNFPYKEGIVISTGRAIDAVGPNDDLKNSGHPQWSGDSDLSAIIEVDIDSLRNASYIEFDFIPRAKNMSFNFLFASEEYATNLGPWQCRYSDVFAFILTDSNGVSSNLALVPGSQDLVSATSIRPGVPGPGGCEASNEEYFAGINGDDSAISMTGNTTSLVAQSMVNPGETYTIKLVIADSEDIQYDSAIFLEAGSFSLDDVSLGENRTLSNGNPLCEGDIFEMDATAPDEAHYRWFKDGIQLPLFDDQPIVSVNEDGVYEVEVEFSANCISEGRVEIEYIDPFPLDISSTLQEEYILCFDGEGNPFEPRPQLDTKLSLAEYSFDWYRNSVSTGNLIANEDQPSLIPSEPGIYHVVVENLLYNCYLSLSTTVISSGSPTIFEVNILSDMFSNNHSVSINVEGPSEYTFSLDGSTFKEDNVFSNLAPGDYIAYVQDEYKCSVVSKGFYIVDYPRFFTPNGDGANDTWKIANLFEIDNPEIKIFDRFGTVQHQFSDEMGWEWDGTIEGNKAPPSSYWFSLTYDTEDGVRKEYKGYFALKR